MALKPITLYAIVLTVVGLLAFVSIGVYGISKNVNVDAALYVLGVVVCGLGIIGGYVIGKYEKD